MNIKNTMQAVKKSSAIALGLTLLVGANAMANNITTLTQVISQAGVRSVDIVDGTTGTPIANPSVTFSPVSFDWDAQTSTGTLGTSAETIRIYNPTATQVWTVSIAASATTATWSDGATASYDFNDASGATDGTDADSVGGQLTVDPSSATLAGVTTKCTTGNLSLGSSDAFEEGSVDSIDLVNAASGSKKFCRWDLTDVDLSQEIPAEQDPGTYTIDMVLSIS